MGLKFWTPLPSIGSPGEASPTSQVVWKSPTPPVRPKRLRLPSTSGTCVRCLLRSNDSLCRGLDQASIRPVVALAHGHRWACPVMFTGDRRLSQVPGKPIYIHAPLFDPGGPASPCHIERNRCCLPVSENRRPHETLLSRLHHAACMLAVYASPCGSPRHGARLASSPLAKLWLDGTFTRWVSKSISRSLLHSPFPTIQACLAHSQD
jgi:hypothetical protein